MLINQKNYRSRDPPRCKLNKVAKYFGKTSNQFNRLTLIEYLESHWMVRQPTQSQSRRCHAVERRASFYVCFPC